MSASMTHKSVQRHLLLDARIIDSIDNAQLVIGTNKKHSANPLFEEDKPWERRFDNLYANVIWDDEDEIYKCWYSPFIISNSSKGMTIKERHETDYGKHSQEMGICYATSTDGITWSKKSLGITTYDGATDNNILWRGDKTERASKFYWAGPHGCGIFKDLRETNPLKKYKAILKYKTLSVAFSEDGLNWGPAIPCPEADSHGDTHNNAFWAPTLNRYVAITRNWRKDGEKHIRQVARTSSEDFETWEKTEFVLEGLDPNQQLYAMPVFFHGGIYLGLLAVHDQTSDRVWTELTWSADTVKWERVLPGTPLIGNDGVEGDYDWGCVYAASGPIFLQNEVRLYYGGSDGLHTSWRNGYFCMTSLRPDGFAGYSSKQGSITTVPIYDNEADLHITADVRVGGEVSVQALNERGDLIAESELLSSSVTDKKVSWRDPDSLRHFKGLFSQLRFICRDATVYSFVLV